MTNLYIANSPNIGDSASAPAKYFSFGGVPSEIYSSINKNRPLVIGGGGLMFPLFEDYFKEVIKNHQHPIIIWGVGTNTHNEHLMKISDWIKSGTLIGIRDWGSPFQWVPCASCMASELNYSAHPNYKIVAYLHGSYGVPNYLPPNIPTMTNFNTSLQKVISFLASGEFVYTNSYHGIYWATLLGKKVIANAFSSRHRFFKHPPVYVDNHIQEYHFDMAKSYPTALAECREANHQFFKQVKNII